MFCYRRFGHNEGDEPAFTQPLMYKTIARASDRRCEIYAERLVAEGVVTEAEVDADEAGWRATTRSWKSSKARNGYKPNKADWLEGHWTGLSRPARKTIRDEAIPASTLEQLREVGKALTEPPQNFNVNPKILRQLEAKRKMIETGEGIDWATGEALAFGTLLARRPPRAPVRPGCRARHLLASAMRCWSTRKPRHEYIPLNNIRAEPGDASR